MNQTLKQIHDMLVAQHTALSQQLDGITDVNMAKEIVMEMQELLHRIDLTQSLLFKQISVQLDATLPSITQANTALTTAIQQINDVATFVNSVSNLLKGVDQAIDIAKALAG